MERTRYSCLINVAAWKPYRISKYSWVVSSSLIFALGPIGENKIHWYRPSQWEGRPSGAHELSNPTVTVEESIRNRHKGVMMGEYPAENNAWKEIKFQLSTNFGIPKRDTDASARWPWLQTIQQQPAQFIPMYTEKLVIFAGGFAGGKQRGFKVEMERGKQRGFKDEMERRAERDLR